MKKPKVPAAEAATPREGRFIDYFIDMYEGPDQIGLRRVNNGTDGIRQDAANMRSYFSAARSRFISNN